MNYLAHLYLAGPTSASRVGNLMGDFVKGNPAGRYPAAVVAGIRTHRAVDAFTDQHALVADCRRWFSPARRRGAGIILDLCWDHFLHRHWLRFCDQPRERFIAEIYRQLQAYEGELPSAMQRLVARMVEGDWLNSYGELETIGLALDRIALRLREPALLQGALAEVRKLYGPLESVFLALFPEVQQYVQGLSFENHTPARTLPGGGTGLMGTGR